MNLKNVSSVLKLVALAMSRSGQLVRLSNWHEANTQAMRHWCSEHEPSCLNSRYHVNSTDEWLSEGIDRG
jgi:hypothetical protein